MSRAPQPSQEAHLSSHTAERRKRQDEASRTAMEQEGAQAQAEAQRSGELIPDAGVDRPPLKHRGTSQRMKAHQTLISRETPKHQEKQRRWWSPRGAQTPGQHPGRHTGREVPAPVEAPRTLETEAELFWKGELGENTTEPQSGLPIREPRVPSGPLKKPEKL